MRSLWAGAGFALLTAAVVMAPVLGQEPAGAKSTLTVDTRLVVVPAVVRDRKGALINGLTRENFSVQVDGSAQTLRYFDHDTDVPLTLGLLIDTSLSQRNVLEEERAASAAFLDKMLVAQRDKAFLIQFARTVELLQDVTYERGKLQAALKEVEAERPQFSGGGGSRDPDDDSSRGDDGRQGRRGGGRGGMSGGTALYDAVFLASEDVLAKQQKGRRALVLLTDGDDRGSKETLAKAIESAQRADAMVYAIYYKGESFGGGRGFGGGGGGPFGGGGMGGHHGGGGGYPGGGGGQGGGRGGGGRESQVDGKKVLERMCGETGGRVFEVTKKETVAKIYEEIGEELRSQYRLGFTPSAEAASDGYHQLTVNVSGPAVDKKTVVQTRDGYYTRQ